MFTTGARARALIPLVGLCLCLGCARYTLIEPDGGVVAIPANLPVYRQDAHKLMAQKFPEGYEIVREEEVWLSSDTREWHITFRGKEGGSPAVTEQPSGSAAEAALLTKPLVPSVSVSYSSH